MAPDKTIRAARVMITCAWVTVVLLIAVLGMNYPSAVGYWAAGGWAFLCIIVTMWGVTMIRKAGADLRGGH